MRSLAHARTAPYAARPPNVAHRARAQAVFLMTSRSIDSRTAQSVATQRFRLYLLVFLLCYAFSITNRIQNTLYPRQPVFALFLLQSCTNPLLGLGNALVYGTNTMVITQYRCAWARARGGAGGAGPPRYRRGGVGSLRASRQSLRLATLRPAAPTSRGASPSAAAARPTETSIAPWPPGTRTTPAPPRWFGGTASPRDLACLCGRVGRGGAGRSARARPRRVPRFLSV